MELIRLIGVTKDYNKYRALDDVSITIEHGDILGVIGQSGCGKTTLLNLIAGFSKPSRGRVVYQSKAQHKERDLHENLHLIKKNIGFTPQHNSFYDKLTVKENLFHFGKLYGVPFKELRANIISLLKFTKLYDHRNKLAGSLSGGMQKRLDISCSLIHRPKILILDEPTSDLDPILKREMNSLLVEINKQGITVIVASHHLRSIENICNKVVFIHNGKIHSFGHPDDIKKPLFRNNFKLHVAPGSNKEHLIARLKQLPIEKIVDKGDELEIFPKDVHGTIKGFMEIVAEEGLFTHDLHFLKPSLYEYFENVVADKIKPKNDFEMHNSISKRL